LEKGTQKEGGGTKRRKQVERHPAFPKKAKSEKGTCEEETDVKRR